MYSSTFPQSDLHHTSTTHFLNNFSAIHHSTLLQIHIDVLAFAYPENLANLTMDTPDERAFRFMDLPAELRLMVCEYLTEEVICPLTVPDTGVAFRATVVDPGCNLVSRQVHHELQWTSTQFIKYKAVAYTDATNTISVGNIAEALDMVHGFDVYHVQKHSANPMHAGIVPSIPQYAIKAGLRKLASLKIFKDHAHLDLAKSTMIAQAFLGQMLLKLRKNPQVEFRILIPDRATQSRLFCSSPGFVRNTGVEAGHPKFERRLTISYRDQTQMAWTGMQMPMDMAALPQNLATPEEVDCMDKRRN